MLKDWQFNVLFFVGVGGAVVLLLGPEFGLEVGQNPTTVGGIGAILTYVLTQRSTITKRKNGDQEKPKEDNRQGGGG